MALNSVNLVGRLVRDPETKEVNNGDLLLTRFTLAVDKKKKDAGANFIDCTAWNGLAETIQKYVHKGDLFGISGFLDQQSWEKDGEKRTKLEVVVNDIMFLSSKSNNDTPKTTTPPSEVDLSNIPF